MSELEHLADRVSNGDLKAESELYNSLSRPIFTMLRTRTGDPELAADLMQDTFRILLERLRKSALDDSTKLSAFAHGIAINIFKGHYRKTKSRKTDSNSDQVMLAVCEGESQYEQLRRSEQSRLVAQSLEELKNERDREILKRAFVLDEDKLKICQELDLSPAHYDRVIHRAKRRLRKSIENSNAFRSLIQEGS